MQMCGKPAEGLVLRTAMCTAMRRLLGQQLQYRVPSKLLAAFHTYAVHLLHEG